MHYQGQGKLIGYKTYTQKEVLKHVYSVINGTFDPVTELFMGEMELITIVHNEQVLKDIKCQNVSFEVTPRKFDGKLYNSYSNIRAVEEASS